MTAAPLRVRPLPALLLSALVLPGLGQALSGRPARGAFMALALALALPPVIIKAAWDLASLWPALAAQAGPGGTVTLADIQAAAAPLAASLPWFLAPPLAVWLWSFADGAIFLFRETRREKEMRHAGPGSG